MLLYMTNGINSFVNVNDVDDDYELLYCFYTVSFVFVFILFLVTH